LIAEPLVQDRGWLREGKLIVHLVLNEVGEPQKHHEANDCHNDRGGDGRANTTSTTATAGLSGDRNGLAEDFLSIGFIEKIRLLIGAVAIVVV